MDQELKERSQIAGNGRHGWWKKISRLPRLPLAAPLPELSRLPPDIWAGDEQRAQQLLKHRFAYGGTEIRLKPSTAEPSSATIVDNVEWQQKKASTQWMREVYGFSWLRDLATGEETEEARTEAVKLARYYLLRWISDRNLPAIARHPDIAGERITMWLRYGEWLMKRAQPAFKRRFITHLAQSIARHRRRLEALGEKSGFAAIKGLTAALIALPESRSEIKNHVLPLLHRSIKLRIAEDGGHSSRCPEQQLYALRQLVEIRSLLKEAVNLEDDLLDTTVHRMAGMLRLYMHGDGKLALFNDTLEGDETEINAVLDKTGGFLSVPAQAKDTGFQRLAMKDSIVIMDCGVPQTMHSRTHFGTLSFEFSHLKDRIIVNCGAFRGSDAGWKEASRKTAAHSTLTLAGHDSIPSTPQELLNLSHVPTVSVEHKETPSAIEVNAVYNGYAPDFHLLHRRRLVLCDNGKRLEGEDSLIADTDNEDASPPEELTAAIRFHLHPDIRATRADDGSITLKTPVGKKWRFSCADSHTPSLAESVYLGAGGKPVKTHQLVVNIRHISPGEAVPWSFERIKST